MLASIKKNSRIAYILDNLDTSASIIGLVAGLAIASLYLISETIHLLLLGLSLSLASLLYLLVRNRNTFRCKPFSSSKTLGIEIVFFSLLTASSLVLLMNDSRPLLYFVLISLAVGFLVLAILNSGSKSGVIFQIFKIVLVSANLKYSIFSFCEGSGIDYWQHLLMNKYLAETGITSVLFGKEISFPMMHIQVAIHQLLLDIPTKDASNTGVLLPLILSSICVFLIAKRIFDARIGLLAMLVVTITDYTLYWGSSPQTTTFGLCLFYFSVLSIFALAGKTAAKQSWLAVFLVLFPTLIFAHAISSFIFLVTITGLLAGSFLFREIYGEQLPLIPTIGVLFVYCVLLIQHWFDAVYSDSGENSFFGVITSTLNFYVTEHAELLNRPEAIPSFAAMLPPLIERAANTTGLALLMFLSVFSALAWLSRRRASRDTFAMIICAMGLMIITFGFPLFGIRNIIPTRWFAFFYLFLAIMAAYAVVNLVRLIPRPGMQAGLAFGVMVALTFFMVTSTVSNLDSPIWLQESTISSSLSFQEEAGTKTVEMHADNYVIDPTNWGSFMSPFDIEDAGDRPYQASLPAGLEPEEQIVIWRTYMVNRPVRVYMKLEGYYQAIEKSMVLGRIYQEQLERYPKIYANRDMSAYYIPGG